MSGQSHHIVIDGRGIYWTGVGRYINGLLANLQELDRVNRYTVLLRPQDYKHFQPTAPNFRVVSAPYSPYSWQEQLLLPRLLRQLRPDLVHFTNPSIPLLYSGRFISTVHDLTLLDYGSARPGQHLYQVKQAVFRLVVKQAISRATVVIAPTKYVQSEIVNRYEQSQDQVHYIPEAADAPLSQAPSPVKGLSGPFLFYLGNYYDYKNVAALIRAFAKIHQSCPEYRLVLGGRTDVFQVELEALCRSLGLSEAVHFTGFISDSELAWLYKTARIFVFPSLSEGFGLPGLEAMNYGLPVASSNATCLPEVYGDAAIYFDPHDPDDMAQVIGDALADPKKLAHLRTAGLKQVKKYSWRRMAEETLAAYQAALSQK